MGTVGIILIITIVSVYSILLILWCFSWEWKSEKLDKLIADSHARKEAEEKENKLYGDLVRIIEAKERVSK